MMVSRQGPPTSEFAEPQFHAERRLRLVVLASKSTLWLGSCDMAFMFSQWPSLALFGVCFCTCMILHSFPEAYILFP